MKNSSVKVVFGLLVTISGVFFSLVGVFFKPLVEKEGMKFAGVDEREGTQGKSQVTANFTPKTDAPGQPAVGLAQPNTQVTANSTPKADAPGQPAVGLAQPNQRPDSDLSARKIGSPQSEIPAVVPTSPGGSPAAVSRPAANLSQETQLPIRPAIIVPREPTVYNNEVQIPKFDNTEVVEYFQSSGAGTGKSRAEAVFNALEETLSKQGSQMSAEVRMKLLSETKRFNETHNRRVDQSLSMDFARTTDGLIRWWDIKREEDNAELYKVQVVGVIAKIKAPSGEHTTRKTLAVLPFRATGSARVLDKTISSAESGRMFRESILTYLVQSRKFAVVDKTFEEELDRLAAVTPATDPIERALQAAVRLGAQYVVIGALEGFGVDSSSAGTSLAVRRPTGSASLRVIEVKSRQTVLAAAYQMDELPSLRLDGSNPETFLVDATGRVMAERILETIYPFKVAALNGPDEVILNRGGEALLVGEIVELFNPGDEIKDPATGESLGVTERKVATAEIIRVLPKVSYARIVQKTEPVVADAVCRKPQQPKKTAEAKTPSIKNEIDNVFK